MLRIAAALAIVALGCAAATRPPAAGADAGPDPAPVAELPSEPGLAPDHTPDPAPEPEAPPPPAPALAVTPAPIEFGGKLVNKKACIDVTLASVGDVPLEITDVRLRNAPGDSDEFEVDLWEMGGFPQAVLAPGESVRMDVCYTPSDQSPWDPVAKAFVQDSNAMVIASNLPEEVAVEGTGYAVCVCVCPQPIIFVEEGQAVAPGTVLHLYGDQSLPETGAIRSHHWTVTQPAGNSHELLPATDVANPTHRVDVEGEYVYCLDVCDDFHCSNDAACNTTACETVVVLATEAIRCELTWDTPGDMDQGDEGPGMGSDMDLHLAHPFGAMVGRPDLDGDGAPDPWFHPKYDVFWANPNPDWESPNPNAGDDPWISREDADGAGPEVIELDAPVDGRRYKVGVHYWDDHGYGFSYPHVRCYLWGQLVLDFDLKQLDQKMFGCDFWEVAEIVWPGGTVKKVTNPDGSLKITHEYQNPAFVRIGGGSCAE